MTDPFIKGLIHEYTVCNWSLNALSVEYGIPQSTLRKWLIGAGVEMRKRGRPVNSERVAAMRAMHNSGATYHQIGRAFGCSRHNVWQTLKADQERRQRAAHTKKGNEDDE